MKQAYFLSLDQGTTSSRAIVFDNNFNILALEQLETVQFFPKPGLVEQDPLEIRENQFYVARKAIAKSGLKSSEITAIGITNQRETTIVWDKNTGKPVYNAIIWQDNRTAEFCNQLKNTGFDKKILHKTGLVVNSYFSATKLNWILNNVEGAKQKAKNGDLLFGTVDTWLIWNLTGGKLHITDFTNASRTMLFDIENLIWDRELLEFFDIPLCMMPEVVDSSFICGQSRADIFDNVAINIAGIAGDQQAALFGQTCFDEGDVKNTYGTGCFMLMNTGKNCVISKSGLLTTIGWKIGNETVYALEGSVFIAGAGVQWLRDKLKIIEKAEDTELIALSIPDNGGVYFVPAFSGLGAPYWRMDADAILCGITGGSDFRHIVRATLEAMAYQTRDVLDAMKTDSEIDIKVLNVDGGAAKNNFIMQFQSDILNVMVHRPQNVESTALGAAMLASLSTGFHNYKSLKEDRKIEKIFKPEIDLNLRETYYSRWKNAVKKSLL
ncbi:MAG TPA: glycerol kinase GlpK [Bacteroidales bacterium]|nr:glycerol kinase GlpK [Bacteroidales bacterium]HOL96910.1 glycerol kinase GlpK [Bacteroidales bacterium]HOM36752.1 glycerol kinase GlpK [Bacteroidales bacterium]HPD24226.1 glycerol kinase GlpK [Bacteroidales bacterium]HRS98467.1 glycerol kinase GlpK [Bacteroidales bacterium]